MVYCSIITSIYDFTSISRIQSFRLLHDDDDDDVFVLYFEGKSIMVNSLWDGVNGAKRLRFASFNRDMHLCCPPVTKVCLHCVGVAVARKYI